jgi:hypothetical protein
MHNGRKLRLDLQDLRVDSFVPTGPSGAKRGTVFGRNHTQQMNCYTYYYGCNYSWDGGTCHQSCPDTCYNTCPGVGGCAPYEETQEPTCLDATCYWNAGLPQYEGQC